MNFLFDGSNFRGYGSESEIIAKGYINDWASGITSNVWIDKDTSHLKYNFTESKTDNYEMNLKLYIKEGNSWMKNKYGFKSKWLMQQYVKNWYDQFFIFNPIYKIYKL